MKKKRVWIWLLTVGVGTGLHFLHDLWPVPLTAVFAPVNESVWEHLKLLFWPMLLGGIFLEKTSPVPEKTRAGVRGAVLAMKGMAAKEELAECGNAIKKLGLKIEEVREFPIDGTAHAVIVLRKVAPTPAKFPRRFAQIKKSPL